MNFKVVGEETLGSHQKWQENNKKQGMLPYPVTAIDYAAYQSRPGLTSSNNAAPFGAFTHSWLVPTQDLSGASFKPIQQPSQETFEPGHVSREVLKLSCLLNSEGSILLSHCCM